MKRLVNITIVINFLIMYGIVGSLETDRISVDKAIFVIMFLMCTSLLLLKGEKIGCLVIEAIRYVKSAVPISIQARSVTVRDQKQINTKYYLILTLRGK